MVVVTSHQGHRQGQISQHGAQALVAARALVLAEIAADQQQIRSLPAGGQLIKGRREAVAQPMLGSPTPDVGPGVGQKVGVAQLQQTHGRAGQRVGGIDG